VELFRRDIVMTLYVGRVFTETFPTSVIRRSGDQARHSPLV
jgi:hypothetical protein